MRRSTIRKASSFKLQAERARFQNYLQAVGSSPVVKQWPSHLQEIKGASEAAYEMCYTKEDSAFIRALNYDCRFTGFRFVDNIVTYRDYLGTVAQAFLYGDFNGFDENAHQMKADEELGAGWWRVEWDLNELRLEEGSRVMVRTVNAEGKEHRFAPPSCFFRQEETGLFRKYSPKAQHASKHRVAHLLAYTIDLEITPLRECLAFIEAELDLLECFNTVILKNLLGRKKAALDRFSLSGLQAEQLQEIVERLSQAGIKVVLEWNFQEAQIGEEPSPLELEYFHETSTADYQLDLSKESVLAYFLGAIAHYIKFYGVGGVHLTKVHKICQEPQGPLLVRLVNLLCERLREDCITLASSKQFIPGLTWPILEGGLGFSFTYNFHESLSLEQQHDSIYQMAHQIQSSSNCLSLTLAPNTPTQCTIYLLFTLLIARRGIFMRGPVGELREDLKQALKLRRQEELFAEECTMERIDDDCIVVSRGKTLMLFNFSQNPLTIAVPALPDRKVLFSSREAECKEEEVVVGGLGCVLLE